VREEGTLIMNYDYADTAFRWLQRLSRLVLVLMATAILYTAWLSITNWTFIAV
jgi:hypothetical protein